MEAEVHTQIITTDKKTRICATRLRYSLYDHFIRWKWALYPIYKAEADGFFFHEAYDCAALKSLTTLKHRMDLYQIYLTAHWLCVTVGW